MLTAARTISWLRTVCEATDLYHHIGYYEEYFEDVWRATGRAEGAAKDKPAVYDLALYAYAHAASKSTRRLLAEQGNAADFLARFGQFWPEYLIFLVYIYD